MSLMSLYLRFVGRGHWLSTQRLIGGLTPLTAFQDATEVVPHASCSLVRVTFPHTRPCQAAPS